MVHLSILIKRVPERHVREGLLRLNEDSEFEQMLQLCDFVMDLRLREELRNELRLCVQLVRF